MSMINELINFYPITIWVFLGIFYLLIGSFLNVVIYRLPLMEGIFDNLVIDKKINLCYPRSFCQLCKQQISAWQNIPLLSFIFLQGRCHNCNCRISWYYPATETLCLLLSLLVSYYFGLNLILIFILPFVWLLICLSFIDLKHQLLPDSLTTSLLWLGLLANTQNNFTTLTDAVYAAVIAYLSLWLFIKLFYFFTGKIGMGNGDFKLFAALGAWFGCKSLVVILFISSIFGSSVGLVYLIASGKSKNTPIPFGPFLCLAGFIYLFLNKYIAY